jgi:SHS2 domain-containing protein
MDKFLILDISGDVGIKAFGESMEEAFINAALGMYSLITNIDEIENKKTINVTTESDSLEGLLVSWLNELIFQFDTYGFIGKEIEIGGGELSGGKAYNLKASIAGEEFDPERHERKLLIKAATYHRIKVEKIDGKWEINVIFDI